MKGDFTRDTFKKEKHYSGVRMQQGRVQVDADWNEQVDIQISKTTAARLKPSMSLALAQLTPYTLTSILLTGFQFEISWRL